MPTNRTDYLALTGLALSALILTATLVLAISTPANSQTPPNWPHEYCKLDAAYNVHLGRRPDHQGWRYWIEHLNARHLNGNQAIELYIPASSEYFDSLRSARRLSNWGYAARLVAWNYPDKRIHLPQVHWYINYIQEHGRAAALAYATDEVTSRCGQARATRQYVGTTHDHPLSQP
jgi:hypothetical protein